MRVTGDDWFFIPAAFDCYIRSEWVNGGLMAAYTGLN
jgi:hypothetical protein